MDMKACAQQHFGLWMAEPHWLAEAVGAVKAGVLRPIQVTLKAADGDEDDHTADYLLDNGGIATIPISGSLTKHQSSFGGTSMVMARRAIVRADQNPNVAGIMLLIDSPGGTVSGTFDLADTVAAVETPVHAYAQDQMASAALIIGSQADHVSGNESGQIGSIGCVAQVVDTSGVYDKAGAKVHVISTGKFKGAFADGSEITDEQVEYLQQRVDAYGQMFLERLVSGRGMDMEQAKALATGEVWLAAEAKAKGLIDEVESLEAAYDRLEEAARASEAGHYVNQTYGGENMGILKKGEEAQSAPSAIEVMDQLEEAFEGLSCKAALVNKAFRAGVEPEAAASIAGAFKAEMEARDKEVARCEAAMAEMREAMEEKDAALAEKDKELEGLKERLGEGNDALDEASGHEDDADFMSMVDAYQKENGCDRGKAIEAVQQESPDAHSKWLQKQQG